MTSVAACVAAVFFVAAGPASAGPKDAREKDSGFTAVLLASEAGPDDAIAAEFAVGLNAALGAGAAGDPVVTLRREALPAAGKVAEAFAAWKKTPPAVVLVWAPDGRTRDVEDTADKLRVPTLFLSPEAIRTSADPKRTVLWAGGGAPGDEALQAMDFLLLPLGAHRPAILHDGSPRAADVAARCMRLHHVSQDPAAPATVTDAFDAAAATAITAGGADGIVYFGRAELAERVVASVGAAGLKVPILLGQGLANGAVPTFSSGKCPTGWALGAEWFEDYGQVAAADKAVIDAAAKAANGLVTAEVVRGYRTGRWTLEALRTAGSSDAAKVVAAFRGLERGEARKKRVFDDFGRAQLVRFGPWRSPAERDGPACRRVRPTLMPMQGIPQVGTFHPSKFEWHEGTLHVQCSFGEGAVRTIEKDLQALGLNTGGYESDLESRILDDLMGRFISRMNRLYLRNPDGTAIPGVSYKVSFVTTPPPKGAKGVKLKAFLAGDNPDTGGVASGVTATIFTTFIQRTIYLPQKLNPAIAATDRPYLSGTYRWGTSVAENLRCDSLRALVDGYSQGLSLTGAHEVGHLCGLGHDTESPRSLMNVVEAVGLDFDWAEWIPSNAKTLDTFLGRE
ncbi:MAG: hypothetical protein K8T90_13215 [Planctomycetes bacterium]|nr:hypothetical protein [Planctomycetota bacterium]